MIKPKKEYKIALTVIAALLILLWGVNFLKGKNLLKSGTVYYGVYSRIQGLTEASPVYYHGYKIGTVREIEFLPGQEDHFVVLLSLTKEIPLYRSTVAQIYSLDLMGTKAVQLVNGVKDQLIEPGDTLQTSVVGDLRDQVSTEVMPLKDKVENLVVKLDTTLSSLSKVFSDKNNRSLEVGMISFRRMMGNLDRSTAELSASLASGGAINNALANIDSITNELNRQREAISVTMENVARFSEQLKTINLDTLAGRIDSGLIVVNDLLQKTREGEGSLGLLLSDEGLYYNLMDASASLDRLLVDVRHNPKRYFNISAFDFGREMYIKVDDEKAKEQGIVYKVKVAESKEPLSLKNQTVNDKYRIFEDSNGKKYIYTIGATSSYSEIKAVRDEIIHEYPNAVIVAFQGGRPVKVVKALKHSEERN
jgi:phospholipid/cholesterol/gamma-HCH transport system substrate-binding protein